MNKENERITVLQVEAAHLRMANEELSSEVLMQWKRIEHLERKIAHLENRMSSVEDLSEVPEANVKPPHW